jgi:negative regulator of flagellin synthesis FlgM
MRIDAYTQITQVYSTEKKNNIKQNIKTTKNDEVEISQQGRDYQIAKKAVADTSDVREDLVAKYRSDIQSGKYDVSANDFANKVIDSYNKLML